MELLGVVKQVLKNYLFMTIEVTQKGPDLVIAYIIAKKSVEVKINWPDNPLRTHLYSLVLDTAQKYFRGHVR